MVKVSVIMPAYNAEIFLSDAIESILNQTFHDFEFIIINDGSVDKTAEIIKNYKDKRIKFIDNKQNQGLISVLNQGIDLCNGEYIARMDSDDISFPERFEKQVKYLDSCPDVGILGTAYQTFGENIKEKTIFMKEHVAYMDTVLGCPVAHPSVMIRKSVLNEYNLRYRPEYKHAEDYDLWARAIRYTRIANLPDVLLKYRIHTSSISVTNHDTQRDISEKISSYMLDFLTNVPKIQSRLKKLAKLTRRYNK